MTKKEITLLAVIIALAVFFRFYGLYGQGFFMHDEVAYLFQTEHHAEAYKWAFNALLSILHRTAPQPYFYMPIVNETARPLHILFLIPSNMNVDFGLMTMASFGILSIIVLLFLVKKSISNENSFIPILSVFLLAVSPVHIFHSRTLLAEVDGQLFFLLSLILYQNAESKRRLVISGIIAGIAVLVQSRLFLLYPFLIFWEIINYRSIKRFFQWLMGFALPLLAVEGIYRWVRAIFLIKGFEPTIPSYFMQWKMRAFYDGGGFNFSQPLFGIKYIIFTEGILFFTLACIGAIRIIFDREKKLELLILIGAASIFVSSCYEQWFLPHARYGRLVAPAVPFMAVSAAYAIKYLLTMTQKRKLFFFILIALIMIPRIEIIFSTVNMKSDYESIFQKIKNLSAVPLVSDYPLHAKFYLGRDLAGGENEILNPHFALVIDEKMHRGTNDLFDSIKNDSPIVIERSLRASPLMYLEGVRNSNFEFQYSTPKPAKLYSIENYSDLFERLLH